MSCSLHEAADLPKPDPISVNGVVIPREDIAQEIQNHPSPKPIAAWQAAAQALVIRELLLQEARRLGIEPKPVSDGDGRRETEVEALIRQLVEEQVRVPTVDEVICRRFFENNRRYFRSADIFMVRHILIAAPREKKERNAARRSADAIIEELHRNPSRFGEFAQTYSDCPSRAAGGNLGQIGPGQTVPEFERGLELFPVGEVGREPIESRYGFHVVLVDQRIEGKELPFDLVQDRIAGWLTEKVQRTAVAQYLSILAGSADIQGVEIKATKSPLVQ